MGSTGRNLHNDRVRTTEVKDEDTANITKSKRKWDDDYGKRSSSATLLRKHQQNDAFESSSRLAFKNFTMGWRLMVKNNVTSSLQRMKILSTNSSYQSKENLVGKHEWLMSYGTCQLPLRVCVFSWFPWPARPLLVSLTSSLCCSESEDSRDQNSWIHSSNSLCVVTCFSSFRVHLMIWCTAHCR